MIGNMEKNKYRVVTDGDVFRIELYWSEIRRRWIFFGKKIFFEGWVPCDNVGQFAIDDGYDGSGILLEEEIVEYSSLEEAKAKIKDWTTPILPMVPIVWNVVWP